MICKVLKTDTSVTSVPEATSRLIEHITSSDAHEGCYVCVFNVHMCMIAFDDDNFANIVNNANLVVPDGRPIYWAQKLLGYKEAQQVRGMDLMLSLCKTAAKEKIKVGLFGGNDQLLNKLSVTLLDRFPDLPIVLKIAPPFRTLTMQENREFVYQINSARVQLLFVALGCPKQELWMAKNKNELHCVMLGVGAAFDFIAGTKRDAPQWIQSVGMEWLFRFLSEPRRLWYRYFYYNPRFIWYLLIQHFRFVRKRMWKNS